MDCLAVSHLPIMASGPCRACMLLGHDLPAFESIIPSPVGHEALMCAAVMGSGLLVRCLLSNGI